MSDRPHQAQREPWRVAVSSAAFDFTVGQGLPGGSDDETDPQVGIAWSHDGGATWANSVLRRGLGAQGAYDALVRVNRLGLSTHHGIRFRLDVSAPVHTTFRGGTVEAEARRA